MKASRFALYIVSTASLLLACGSGVATEAGTETTDLGTSTEDLAINGSTESTPVTPATTDSPVAQAAPHQGGGGGEIDGNKDCGGWCHYQCCGDKCTTGDAVACVASCIKFMCMPTTKISRF